MEMRDKFKRYRKRCACLVVQIVAFDVFLVLWVHLSNYVAMILL